MTAVDFMYRSPGDMLVTSCPRCRHEYPLPTVCCPRITLELPADTPCTVTVHPRVQVGMTGGGIVQGENSTSNVILQKVTSGCGGRLIVNSPPVEDRSPSSPLAFVIPTSNPWDNKGLPSETDLQRLSSTMKALRTSGWYYEGLSWQASAVLLQSTSPGTFLVRDSNDPRFLFSLSVQTDRGPTSVRMHYHDGHFRLDAAPRLVPIMPVFQSVVELVQYYVTTTAAGKRKGREQVWIDCSGQAYSNILLTKPLYQRQVPGLQHLARLAVNRLKAKGQSIPARELPECLHRFLDEYPFLQ